MDSRGRVDFADQASGIISSKTKYVLEGEGENLLLLHGFCESNAIFQTILPRLAADFRVLAPNLPGHAGSPWAKDHFRKLDDAAFWLRDLLDLLEIQQCTLVGHSLGGYIAIAFAERFPERLKGLGLLHSTGLADMAERKENRTKALKFIQKQSVQPFLKAFLEALFWDPKPEWTSELREIIQQTDTEAILALIQIMRDRPDRSNVLKTLDMPLMYIYGSHDKLISAERSQIEHGALEMALVYRIAEAGHMAMYEAPEKVIHAIQSLMQVSIGY